MNLTLGHLNRSEAGRALKLVLERGVVELDLEQLTAILRLPGSYRVTRSGEDLSGFFHTRDVPGGCYVDLWGVRAQDAKEALDALIPDLLGRLRDHRCWAYVEINPDDPLRKVFHRHGFTVSEDEAGTAEPLFSGSANLSDADAAHYFQERMRTLAARAFKEHLESHRRFQDPAAGAAYTQIGPDLCAAMEELISSREEVYGLRYQLGRMVLCYCFTPDGE